jgi:LysM repeat protein
MKLPRLLPKKQRKPKRPGKLAATARRTARTDDYVEEPNMRLSSAFIVVLLLHVVAVGGIYAFNTIKARGPGVSATPDPAPVFNKKKENTRPATSPARDLGASAARWVSSAGAETRAPAKPVAKKASAPAPKTEKPTASGKIYTVVKGDNPVSIARRLKVRYEDLIKLNNINDPRKLQIGQKLKIPARKNG